VVDPTRVKQDRVANPESWFSPADAATSAQRERNRRRADGWIAAAATAIGLWVIIGLVIWAVARTLG
jgi:hypothetical protein